MKRNLYARIRRYLGLRLQQGSLTKEFLKSADLHLVSLKHAMAMYFPALIQPSPTELQIAITANCNLRCIGCRYGRDFMPGSQLSWDIVRELLDDARDAGISSIRLYGGEPLLHPDLPKMVEHCSKLQMKVYVTTNAVLLDKRIDELYSAGLRAISVGFYGTGGEYDDYVQRRNQFAAVERGIAAVRSRYGNSVSLQLNWLLSRPTCRLDALESAWTFAQRYEMRMQVDLIHYSLPYFTEGPDRELQFRPEDEVLVRTITDRLVALRTAHPDGFQQSEVGLRSIPDWLMNGPNMRVPCDKYNMIWVGADGTVQLCYVTFRLGNLREMRLKEMLFKAEHKRAARGAFQLNCPNCHCNYDTRTQKHTFSRRGYSAENLVHKGAEIPVTLHSIGPAPLNECFKEGEP